MTTAAVNISSIAESPTNPRKHFPPDAELVASIKTYGVLQAILVRPMGTGFECVFGHRRLRAAEKAGLDKIPAQVRTLTDSEVLEAQIVENCQREDMHPLEEADAYRAAVDAGALDVDELAAKIGKSKSHVYGRLRLAELGKAARKAFAADTIGASVAMSLTRIEGKRQDEALKAILASPHNAHWTLRQFQQDLRSAPFSTSDAELVSDAGACGPCPKRTDNQKDLFGGVEGDQPNFCTDHGCFQRKVAANWQQTKTRAEAKGLKVLDDAFDQHGNLKSRDLVRGDGHHAEGWRLAKNQTWKQLVGKALKPAIALGPRGDVVELYDRLAAAKAIPADIKAKLRPERSPSSTRAAKRGVDERKVQEVLEQRMAKEAAEKGALIPEADLHRMLALDSTNAEGVSTAIALGWMDTDEGPTAKSVEGMLAQAAPDALRGFLAAHVVMCAGTWGDKNAPRGRAWHRHQGVA